MLNPLVKIPYTERLLCIRILANKLFEKLTFSNEEGELGELDHSGKISIKFLQLWRVIVEAYNTL